MLRIALPLALALLCCAAPGFAAAPAAEPVFPRFDVRDTGAPPAGVPEVAPWRIVPLDPDYAGQWAVAGDVDGDGAVEIVAAENVNVEDTHYTSAVAAHRLDGSVLWRWGNPDAGRKTWHHDVACQIHDWDGDGKNEVVVCDKQDIVELDGATGAEKRRIPIAEGATDCLVFCDLAGRGRPEEVLVKDRYLRIWAYSRDGALLWDVTKPGGYRTAHQPFPVDVDGDGRDEILAGYALLNPDGSVRWVYETKEPILPGIGHLDCARVLRAAETPEGACALFACRGADNRGKGMRCGDRAAETRIVFTCCGANNIAVVDGAGAVVWERPGLHFESVQTGNIVADAPGPQILVDVDHTPDGASPMWVLDADGAPLGRITTRYSRHHRLLDWTGDGLADILAADSRGVYDGTGKRVATFATPGAGDPATEGYELSLLTGDCDNDGVPDVLIITPGAVYVYRNENGKRPEGPAVPGTGMNVTLY